MAGPMYRQIAQDLLRKIESGELEPGARLPNEMEFREEYDASRNTIRDAIKWLTIRGLVETKPGQGTFVVRHVEPIVTTLSEDPETGMAGGEGKAAFVEINKRRAQRDEQRRQERDKAMLGDGEDPAADQDLGVRPEDEPRASAPTVEVKFAPAYVAERLRIPDGAEVLVRHQEFFIGRTPWSLQTTFYPFDLMSRGKGAPELMRARDIEVGTVEYLRDTLGLVQCGYRVRILVRRPNEAEGRFFGLPDDGRVPVVSLIRTGYEDTADGPYPFRLTITVLPADRNQFVINSGKYPEELAAPARDQ
jgi:GntR family transcriptional regulator